MWAYICTTRRNQGITLKSYWGKCLRTFLWAHIQVLHYHWVGYLCVSACCVPGLLGPDLKRARLNMSRENQVIFQADPNSFLQRFVTMDETWVHHFQPETKQQSKQMKHLGSLPLQAWWWSAVGGLPRQGSHYHRSLLCWSSETLWGKNQPDSAWKSEVRSVLPQGQCSSTHVHMAAIHVDSNLLNTHPILVIWLPLTTTSSLKLKRSSVVIILP